MFCCRYSTRYFSGYYYRDSSHCRTLYNTTAGYGRTGGDLGLCMNAVVVLPVTLALVGVNRPASTAVIIIVVVTVVLCLVDVTLASICADEQMGVWIQCILHYFFTKCIPYRCYWLAPVCSLQRTVEPDHQPSYSQ